MIALKKTPYFKITLIKNGLIIVILLWAVTATLYAISQSPEVVVVGADENGIRVLKSDQDPLLRRESLHFLRRFLTLYYNWTPETFAAQMGEASDMMSSIVWERLKPELLKTRELLMKGGGYSQSGKVLEISKTSENEFEAKIDVTTFDRLKAYVTPLKVSFKLGPRKRPISSPWGYELQDFREEQGSVRGGGP